MSLRHPVSQDVDIARGECVFFRQVQDTQGSFGVVPGNYLEIEPTLTVHATTGDDESGSDSMWQDARTKEVRKSHVIRMNESCRSLTLLTSHALCGRVHEPKW